MTTIWHHPNCTTSRRVLQMLQDGGETPEVIDAYNVTGEDSWILQIAVIDVAHLDAVVTRFWLLSAMAAIAGVCIFYGDWLSAVGFSS